MSLYARYSESSISVSYFSRSSALIRHSFAPTPPSSRGTWSHLPSPVSPTFGRRVRFAFGDHPGARRGRHAPHVDEGIPVLRGGPQPGQRRRVRGRAVALVIGEAVAG